MTKMIKNMTRTSAKMDHMENAKVKMFLKNKNMTK